ncbi:MAG: ABC transporter substrate-binding protein [Planctomycetota bacterium]
MNYDASRARTKARAGLARGGLTNWLLLGALCPLLATACSDSTESKAPAAADVAASGASGVPDWAVKLADELQGGVRPEDLIGPHPSAVDVFHPDQREVRPALGGRVIVHIEAQPKHLNYALENSAIGTFIRHEIHAALLRFNFETWEQDYDLATHMDIEDTLVLTGGRGAKDENIVIGLVSEDGEDYVVRSGSAHNPLTERRVPKSQVESVLKGTVFSFDLRPGVQWHDGHLFDADDVLFSMDVYKNPSVDCDNTRFRFLDVVRGEKLGPLAVRFFYAQQYFSAVETFNETLFLMPRHLYDLSDPDNKDHKPDATQQEQGTYINENPHNTEFVGLGPYRLTTWERGQYLEAVRFDEHYEKDPAKRGYLDTIRWRYIDGDDAAFTALLNEDLDIFRRVKTEDYYSEATKQPAFVKNYYKAYSYVGLYGFLAWNMTREKFKDVRVRTALAHAFDTLGWVKTKYMGLAVAVTGPAFFVTPAYNHAIKPLAYDPARAEELLAEAGWYDRNGDGTIDKNGEEMVIDFLMPSGNRASQDFGQKLQEGYAQIGVKLTISQLEWASFIERLNERDFDSCNLAWILPAPESDPKQIWHSSEAARKRSSNRGGFADAQVDAYIDALRLELDTPKRLELWHKLHARIYELQPYLFSQTPPTKYAFNKKLRGLKLYNWAPGYRVRDLYYEEGTPGTRPLNSN